MSYSATTWSSGDVITAEKLNKIEQGISNKNIISAPFICIADNYALNCSYNDIKNALLANKKIYLKSNDYGGAYYLLGKLLYTKSDNYYSAYFRDSDTNFYAQSPTDVLRDSNEPM